MDSAPTPSSWFRSAGLWLAPALLLAAGAIVILFNSFGIDAGISNRLFDAYQRHAPRPFADTANMPVRVLELPALDEDSLVEVTRALSAQGARVIVFTAPVEPGPSPLSLSARLPPGSEAVRAALAKLPEPGHDLAAAIAETKAVIPILLGMPGGAPRVKAHFVYRGAHDPFARVPHADAAAAPPALLESNAAGVAAANLIPDSDGVVRRMPLAFRSGAVLVPGLAVEALRVAGGATDITMISDEHDPLSFLSGIGIAALETPGGPVSTDRDGQVRLHYAANISRRMLNPNALTATPLTGAIVVVGMEGPVVKTPLGAASLPSVIAETIENLAGNAALVRPGWTRVLEALLLAALGTAMIFLLRFGLGWAAALTMAAPALLGLTSWYLYTAHGLLFDAATPALFLCLAFAAGAAVWLYSRKLTHAGLRATFSDSLPQPVIEQMARRHQLSNLAGEIRTVTCLVCEVGGLAADHPADFTGRMQKILAPLADQALAHGGVIDRLTPGGFAAFWNAPLDDADHALHACAAADGMAIVAARAEEEVAQHRPDGTPWPLVQIGVATGAVIAGGFGGPERLSYGIHGDAVALAHKLHALAPHYGARLLAAGKTRQLADLGFAFLEIDSIAAGADDAPVLLYALMGDAGMRASPKFRALTVFHDHIFQAIRKQNWRVARELIAQCRRLSGANQRLYDLHLARIAYYEKNPPGENWDGAFRPILE